MAFKMGKVTINVKVTFPSVEELERTIQGIPAYFERQESGIQIIAIALRNAWLREKRNVKN